jgi:hypothetical protein
LLIPSSISIPTSSTNLLSSFNLPTISYHGAAHGVYCRCRLHDCLGQDTTANGFPPGLHAERSFAANILSSDAQRQTTYAA